ncbi:HK97-gp10 family putative phage morphogenesis protein [Streptomyces sp. TR02-1]|uniref:HK97-gp10 family putative phage morphogenesis protein n=1 Tax=Streptomyces sp. TR02-1 TaxID=3385977 RepID=UPI00399F5043
MSEIEIRINESEWREFLTGPRGVLVREARRLGNRVLNAAKRRCPVDEGQLRASLAMAIDVQGPDRVVVIIGSPLEYARYVHEGTGIYGPRGRPIRPVRAQVLRFEVRNPRRTPRGRGNVVYATEVKGQRPQPFLWEALVEVIPDAVRNGT